MTRFVLFMLAALTASSLLAQGQPNEEAKAYQKFQHDAYPPLYEQIQVTIQKASQLTIRHRHADKDISWIGFDVNLKNIGENNCTWSPDAIKIEVVDAEGVAVPANHVKQFASRPEVDPASYEIKKGRSSAKRIALVIEDDAVKIGTKYRIVASYVKLWKWPEAKYDLLSTALTVEAVAEKP